MFGSHTRFAAAAAAISTVVYSSSPGTPPRLSLVPSYCHFACDRCCCCCCCCPLQGPEHRAVQLGSEEGLDVERHPLRAHLQAAGPRGKRSVAPHHATTPDRFHHLPFLSFLLYLGRYFGHSPLRFQERRNPTKRGGDKRRFVPVASTRRDVLARVRFVRSSVQDRTSSALGMRNQSLSFDLHTMPSIASYRSVQDRRSPQNVAQKPCRKWANNYLRF